ncbi:lycopene cyclase family protein [Amnibacterium endophyticum]|uniref:Lycopene cyclase family protein n=1 Tax=Amnibacterium endophyticum TaxID=2109337 RepID=A0ABW4LEN8_9MICO
MSRRPGRPDLVRTSRPVRRTQPVDTGRVRRRAIDLAADAATTVVVGGGCAGLALGVALAERGVPVVVADERPPGRDGRTWCHWDTGESLLPEASTRAWDRWEVRAGGAAVVAADPAHPYRLVRAHDYRAAAAARLAAASAGALRTGVRVEDVPEHLRHGDPLVVDARGPLPAAPVPPGRTVLHQRFVGRWVRTARPVFDDGVVTLMDFDRTAPGEDVRFFYVLPVAPDLALVECTVFARDRRRPLGLRDRVDAYVHERWGLEAGEWTVEGEEAGSIPMTDAPPPPQVDGAPLFGVRAGLTRPSSGYAYTRIQRAARDAAAAIARGEAPATPRDRPRTRLLDAVFLRFLRDRPELAGDVFVAMFAKLPGPLTVRFLTERSSPVDDLRMVLALPKVPFLRAAAATARERVLHRS